MRTATAARALADGGWGLHLKAGASIGGLGSRASPLPNWASMALRVEALGGPRPLASTRTEVKLQDELEAGSRA